MLQQVDSQAAADRGCRINTGRLEPLRRHWPQKLAAVTVACKHIVKTRHAHCHQKH